MKHERNLAKLAILPTPNSVTYDLTQEERSDFSIRVRPHAKAAQEITATLKRFKELQQEQAVLMQLRTSHMSEEDFEALVGMNDIINEQIAELGGVRAMSLLTEERRVFINEIISHVNQLKVISARRSGMAADAAVLVSKPQVKPVQYHMNVPERKSPGLAHNDLYDFPNQRSEDDLKTSLVQTVLEIAPKKLSGLNDIFTAVSLTQLLPRNIVRPDLGHQVPVALRNEEHVASGIVDLTEMVLGFRGNTLTPPNAAEIGQRAKDQEVHIKRFLETTLYGTLQVELTRPDLSELQLRSFYQTVNKSVRDMVTWLGRSDQSELVHFIIESLPDVHGAMLVSRFSDALYADLGYPYASVASEVRYARGLRNAAYEGNFSRSARMVNELMGKLEDRVENGDINCRKIIEEITSLDYHEDLVQRIKVRADSHFQDILRELFLEDRSLHRSHYTMLGD